MATTPDKRDPTISDARPAAAAAASRWPRFDFRDVHCTCIESVQRARTAAPTYMSFIIGSTKNGNIPRSDRPEQFQCRAPQGSRRRRCIARSRSIAFEISRWEPSSSRLARPIARRTREYLYRLLLWIAKETRYIPRHGNIRLPAGRTYGIAREKTAFLRQSLLCSPPR